MSKDSLPTVIKNTKILVKGMKDMLTQGVGIYNFECKNNSNNFSVDLTSGTKKLNLQDRYEIELGSICFLKSYDFTGYEISCDAIEQNSVLINPKEEKVPIILRNFPNLTTYINKSPSFDVRYNPTPNVINFWINFPNEKIFIENETIVLTFQLKDKLIFPNKNE